MVKVNKKIVLKELVPYQLPNGIGFVVEVEDMHQVVFSDNVSVGVESFGFKDVKFVNSTAIIADGKEVHIVSDDQEFSVVDDNVIIGVKTSKPTSVEVTVEGLEDLIGDDGEPAVSQSVEKPTTPITLAAAAAAATGLPSFLR